MINNIGLTFKHLLHMKKSELRISSNIHILVFVVLFFTLSCNNNRKEVERLKQENDSLRSTTQIINENIDSYFSDLNEIENNLQVIKEKENLITQQATTDVELGLSQQDRINEDIKVIGDLMEKNRMLIANLNNRIRNADNRIEGFELMIERLNRTIEEKEIEIQLLRDQLSSMNLRVDFLSARVDTLERIAQERREKIEQQNLALNTAWYAIGSGKELRDNKIILREGGFLGFGRTEVLNPELNKDFFTRIDISRDYKITIMGNSPEVITNHPLNSYVINEESDELFLEIIDTESFWSTTRYLIIQVR